MYILHYPLTVGGGENNVLMIGRERKVSFLFYFSEVKVRLTGTRFSNSKIFAKLDRVIKNQSLLYFVEYYFDYLCFSGLNMYSDISNLEAPVFSTIDRKPPAHVLKLNWDHQVPNYLFS